MKALTLRAGELSLAEIPEPRPSRTQLLARPLACGICGSDLHARTAGTELFDLTERVKRSAPHSPMRGPALNPNKDVHLGHEFCAEVVAVGRDVDRFEVGDRVVSVPRTIDPAGTSQTIGFSSTVPGGFAELMVLDANRALIVPPDLEPGAAAMTEPLAVAAHAIAAAPMRAGQPAIILGCGPIGLAILLLLIARGSGPIVGSDPSPERRAIAEAFGADSIVDPRQDSPGATAMAASSTPPVIFEVVGTVGMINAAMLDAPAKSHVVVVGACMTADTVHPMLAIGRELTMSFVLGYSDGEFNSALNLISSGIVDPSPLITDVFPLSQAIDAFNLLTQPGSSLKVLVGTP